MDGANDNPAAATQHTQDRLLQKYRVVNTRLFTTCIARMTQVLQTYQCTRNAAMVIEHRAPCCTFLLNTKHRSHADIV